MSHVLVTGGSGFIGSHLVERLIADGDRVSVLDTRPSRHGQWVPGYVEQCWEPRTFDAPIDAIVHLAAKPGVRASLEQPVSATETNVVGTVQMLELARTHARPPVVVFASSSSVYGVNPDVPWREDMALQPVSPYAASKVAGEALGHVYSHVYGVPFRALRFFTVFGPRQRTDLAIHRFAERLIRHQPIPLYGDGSSLRDYTYVGDVVDAIVKAIHYQSDELFHVWNIGRGHPVRLDALLNHVVSAFGINPLIDRQPDQPGDVPQTWADASKAQQDLGWHATTSLEDGIQAFAEWYRLLVAA